MNINMNKILKKAKNTLLIAAATSTVLDGLMRREEALRKAHLNEVILEAKKSLDSATATSNRLIEAMNNHADIAKIDELNRQIADLQARVSASQEMVEQNQSILSQIDCSIFRKVVPKDTNMEILDKIQEIQGENASNADAPVSEITEEIIEEIHKAGLDFSSLWDFMKEGYDLFYAYLNSLTDIQALAFSHLLVFIVVYQSIINIFSALIGNWLIEYFKLEEHYPKIGKWIAYRKRFRNYYVTVHGTLATLLVLSICYLDILILLSK